ncbi:MAG: hypothetical protein WCS27_09490 [Victivallaceae bacterium]|jgi:uncharacterized protein YceK
MKTLFLLIVPVLFLTGCASICEYDENGKLISRTDANGILRTMVFKRTYYEGKDGKRGTLKEKTLSTESTSKDVFLGLNEILDTAANTAAKLKP